MLRALSQSESNIQMELIRPSIRTLLANSFYDVIPGFLFFILRVSFLYTLLLLKHGSRIKYSLLAHETVDIIQSPSSRDHSNSRLPNSFQIPES